MNLIPAYNIIIKGNRHRVVDRNVEKAFPHRANVQGRFFIALVTNQVNECQQC